MTSNLKNGLVLLGVGLAGTVASYAWLQYADFVFVATLLPDPGQPILTIERLWFTVLTAGAVFIRMTS